MQTKFFNKRETMTIKFISSKEDLSRASGVFSKHEAKVGLDECGRGRGGGEGDQLDDQPKVDHHQLGPVRPRAGGDGGLPPRCLLLPGSCLLLQCHPSHSDITSSVEGALAKDQDVYKIKVKNTLYEN